MLNTKDSTKTKANNKEPNNNQNTNPNTKTKGVIYVGHIPHGFYERELKQYFSQFGAVTNLRLSRSKRTGQSRGYAFVEFEYEEVAEIAAAAVDGYILFRRILDVKKIDNSKIPPNLFYDVGFRVFNKEVFLQKKKRILEKRKLKPVQKRKRSRTKRLESKKTALQNMGINYEFPVIQNYEAQTKTQSKKNASEKRHHFKNKKRRVKK